MTKKLNTIKALLLRPQTVATGTLSIIFFTIISKIIGFFREMILAANFGANWRLDALIVAMDPPIQIGGMISSAVASMMIPIYLGEKTKNNLELTKKYTSQILFFSSSLLLIFGLILSLFSNNLIKVFAPNFNATETAYAVRKMRLIGFIPMIQGFNALASSVIKAEKRYLLSSVVQVFYNLIAIPVILMFSPILSESSYLLAFILGTLAMNVIHLFIIRKSLSFKDFFNFSQYHKVFETLRLAFPLIFSGSLGVVYNIIDKAFASYLEDGSISSIRYAQTINSMITSIIIGSLITTVFTEMVDINAKNDQLGFERRLKKTSSDLFNLSIPITAWLIAMSQIIISVLFQRGNFTPETTITVSWAFTGYIIAFIITPINMLMGKIFETKKKTKIFFYIAIINVLLNIVFNSLLIKPLGVLGLALSSSLVSFCQFFIQLIYEKKVMKINYLNKKNLLKTSIWTIVVFLIVIGTKTILKTSVWLLSSNLLYILLLICLNKTIVTNLIKKILFLFKKSK